MERSIRLGVCAAIIGVSWLASCANVNPYYDASKPHHRPDGFTNMHGPAGGKPFTDFLRWQYERRRDGLPPPPSARVSGHAGFEVVRPDLDLLHANHRGGRITVTWIGHATLFIQIGGRNILVDPVFSERASPVSFAGPRRRVPVPVRLDELPPVDIVLISHNHYDHLDRPTVHALRDQPAGEPIFFAPLGVDLWLGRERVTRIERLDWWEHRRIEGGGGAEALDIHLTPAHHWSSRSPFDRNATLWGGFVVQAPDFSFWYSGDTGYSRDFLDIRRRFGSFDLAAIPVGSYEPRWFMGEQHVNPAEAVQVFLDVDAREAIGVHWGTFELTDEPLDEPMVLLPKALDAMGIDRSRFALFRHGETRTYRRP
jgi:N-acyl-phosphatidylethanolamine-hydrolysing phospholipase D